MAKKNEVLKTQEMNLIQFIKIHYYISIVKVAFFLCFIGREHIT